MPFKNPYLFWSNEMNASGGREHYNWWLTIVAIPLATMLLLASIGILLCVAAIAWEVLISPLGISSVPHTLPGAAAEWFGIPLLLAWLALVVLCSLLWRFHRHVSSRQ